MPLEPCDEALEMFPDVGAFPLWEPDGEACPQELGLSPQLNRALTDWARYWESHFFSECTASLSPSTTWVATGIALAIQTTIELSGREVRYLF